MTTNLSDPLNFVIDCDDYLKKQPRYEDAYGLYMQVFEVVATRLPFAQVRVENYPACWGPLLYALGAELGDDQAHFPEDVLCNELTMEAFEREGTRTMLEVLCGLRPELTDSLWKCDVQWRGQHLNTTRFWNPKEREFSVTTNGSFHRREIRNYFDRLNDWRPNPQKRKLLLLPCAADKPYPAPLHQWALDRLPGEDWSVMNATGVLGLVPQELWRVMPYYDSGVPNEWRLQHIAAWFFSRWASHYDYIVCHTDYYSLSLVRGFQLVVPGEGAIAGPACPVVFTRRPRFHYDYEDLMGVDSERRLHRALDDEKPLGNGLYYLDDDWRPGNGPVKEWRETVLTNKAPIDYLLKQGDDR